MLRNLADALHDLAELGYDWRTHSSASSGHNNRVQAQGDRLEDIFKDILCGVLPANRSGRNALYSQFLCYQGSANNPPDAMYRGGDDGDAFEVKKKEVKHSWRVTSLDLNSSPPYSHLTNWLTRLTLEARNCETWNKRAIFYAIGNIDPGRSNGNWLWIVQGNLFAEDLDKYSAFEAALKTEIEKAIRANDLIPGTTNELGRVNSVDLRDRTNLRIRPMWGVQSPTSLFKDIIGVEESDTNHLTVHAFIRKEKWESYFDGRSQVDRDYWTNGESRTMTISNIEIPDPDNLSAVLEAKLVRVALP